VKPGQVWDRVLAGRVVSPAYLPALSEGARKRPQALIIAARTGVTTSIDLNYRKLWSKGGRRTCRS
jgi:hypothetical protein